MRVYKIESYRESQEVWPDVEHGSSIPRDSRESTVKSLEEIEI